MSDSKTMKRELAIALAFIVIGGGASTYQLMAGPGVAALSNGFNWGLYIAVFEFLVGIASGCLFIHGAVRFKGFEPLESLKRDAAIAGFAFIAAAGVMIMLDLGDIWHMTSMITSTNPSSPLAGDMVMMTLFVFIALACIFVRGADKPLGILAMLIGLAAPVVTSLIFSELVARAWWHTMLVPIGFVFIGLASGAALMMIIGLLKFRGEDRASLQKGTKALCMFAAVMTGAFLLTELVHVAIAAGTTATASVVASNGIVFGAGAAALIVAFVLFLMQRKNVSTAALGASAGLLLAGDFLYRMMLLYGGLNTIPLTLASANGNGWSYPVSTGVASQSTFMSCMAYLPNPMEWAVMLLPLGLALALLVVLRLWTAQLDGKAAAKQDASC